MENGIKQFEVGKTYHLGHPFGDNTTLTRKVVKRTAKTVTVEDEYGKLKMCRIKIVNGEEWIWPYGHYSKNPIIDASHIYLGAETERALDPLWDFEHQEPELAC